MFLHIKFQTSEKVFHIPNELIKYKCDNAKTKNVNYNILYHNIILIIQL